METQILDQGHSKDNEAKVGASMAASNWPDQIFQKLRAAEIRQVVYVQDAGDARLIEFIYCCLQQDRFSHCPRRPELQIRLRRCVRSLQVN